MTLPGGWQLSACQLPAHILSPTLPLSGGIYVQEPDACPASVAALVQLVNNHPGHFPMGFAYGHLSSKAVAIAGHKGRGLAAQQLLEEFSSQKRLNGNVSGGVGR